MQLMREKDAQIQTLVNSVLNQNGVGAPVVPIAEVSAQIPTYGDEDSISLQQWIRKIDDLQILYGIPDQTVKILATNRLKGKIRQWYDAAPAGHLQTWAHLKGELLELFGDSIDENEIREKIRNLRWMKNEPFEDYFHHKVSWPGKSTCQTRNCSTTSSEGSTTLP